MSQWKRCNGLPKLVNKQGVSERPECYIFCHTVKFDDKKEGFRMICCTKCISVAILAGWKRGSQLPVLSPGFGSSSFLKRDIQCY